MSFNASACPGLLVNSDITGIGVRVSFYLQTFLLVLLVNRSWQDAPGALWTLTATSFGLTITALQQVIAQSMGLFDAIAVSNLVWQSNFASYLALASYSRHKNEHERELREKSLGNGSKSKEQAKLFKPDNQAKIGAILQIWFSCILTIYMWATAQSFGTNIPECNDTVIFMIFVIQTSAVGGGRIAALLFSCILTVLYMIITFHELKVYMNWRWREKGHSPSPNSSPEILPTSKSMLMVPVHRATGSSISGSHSDIGTPTITRKRKAPSRKRWSCEHTDASLVTIIAFQTITTIYFVVSSELLLIRNIAASMNPNDQNASSNNNWGFGQILSLVVIAPPLLSVINAFWEHGFGKVRKSDKRNPLKPIVHTNRTQTTLTP